MYQDKQFKTLRKKLRNGATDAEQKMWQALRKNQVLGYKFTRQYGVGRYVLDFYCSLLRLGIELDGSQHMEPNAVRYDEIRTDFLNSNDIQILRFYDNDVINNLESVLEKIVQVIRSLEQNITP